MPSTIIGSASWNSTGLVLSAQSAQEQVTGLVNVQVTYVAPATKQAQASAKFYLDAPPPIWPSVVSRGELVTNNLYMVDRTIERANGLVTINASYAGGLQRAGFKGFYLREQLENGKRGTAFNYYDGQAFFQTSPTETNPTFVLYINAPQMPTPSGQFRSTTIGSPFAFNERLKIVEFVRIGGASSVTPPVFYRSDLAAVVRSSRGTAIRFSSPSGGFTDSVNNAVPGPEDVQASDLWVVEGSEEQTQLGELSFEKTTAIPSTESTEYVTPTVQVVSLVYRLSR